MIITFFGHRSLYVTDELRNEIFDTIKKIIRQGETVSFYCGGYGDFDTLCARACLAIKKENSFCKTFLVTPYMTESRQRKIKEIMHEKLYDGVIYPPLENTPPKAAIIKRNEWMIREADFIVAYVKNTYGGAYKALQYAQKKKKVIINLAEDFS